MSSEISYSDGDIENEILTALKAAPDVSSSTQIAIDRYSSWPFEYHLSSARSNLVRHIDFKGKRVLEIGAGMGAISRFVAENCKFLQIVEGTSRRISCLNERLRDLKNFDVYCGNFNQFVSEEKFDLVLIIGVLEYAEIYFEVEAEVNPFVEFLKKAKSFLSPKGSVVLAIENRIGLKYWAGATEDHTGKCFDGILGYPISKSVRTFSKVELKTLLNQAGFNSLHFQYPCPDYKLPLRIIDESFEQSHPHIFADIAYSQIGRDYSRSRHILFNESLAFQNLKNTGLMSEFLNSFMVIAQVEHCLPKIYDETTPCVSYTNGRKYNVKTVFQEKDGILSVIKEDMSAPNVQERDLGPITWVKTSEIAINTFAPLTNSFRNTIVFRDWKAFESLWHKYFQWLDERYATSSKSYFSGQSWDAIPQNINCEKMIFKPIDCEWRLNSEMKKSWLILRVILSFDSNLQQILCEKYVNLYSLYKHICSILDIEASYEKDINDEASAVLAITGHSSGLFIDEFMRINLASIPKFLVHDYTSIINNESVISNLKSLISLEESNRFLTSQVESLDGSNRFLTSQVESLDRSNKELQIELEKLSFYRGINKLIYKIVAILHLKQGYWRLRLWIIRIFSLDKKG
ncbi:MAG: hypothetical protein BroJett040_00790 [Oligoflexia bacterium]|nr:MAG: hypothetical protein BroJett040_00790 [Oligoflexia bacterium]